MKKAIVFHCLTCPQSKHFHNIYNWSSPNEQKVHLWSCCDLLEHVDKFFAIYGPSSAIILHLMNFLKESKYIRYDEQNLLQSKTCVIFLERTTEPKRSNLSVSSTFISIHYNSLFTINLSFKAIQSELLKKASLNKL